MRVLLINKFWYPKGGSERYTFLLKDLLEAKGHEVVPFAMQDARNLPTPWARHFAPHVEFGESASGGKPTSSMGQLMSVLWNRRAAAALDGLLNEWKPDVAHLQNFAHQISPSILPVLKRHGVPVVWTLHDYELLCPNYRMYTQGLPCERCKGHNYVNAIRYNCMGSRGASAGVAAEMVLHHVLTNVYADHLDAVIAPSRFLGRKLTEWGWKGRVEVVPNFVPDDRMRTGPAAADPHGNGVRPFTRQGQTPFSVLFVGRLVEEKGVEDVVEAAKLLPEIPFEIVGDGPVGVSNFKFQISNCVWHGAFPPEETVQHIAAARMLVVPSRWYENAPYVVLEAMAAGVPVVATDIGGLPELVRDGETGVIVPPRDPAALASAIRALYADASRAAEFGRRAHAIARTDYGPEQHYARMLEIYHSVHRSR